MDINTVNTIRDFINATSLALCIVIVGLALIGFFRPKTLGFVLREFARRRYILVGGVFAGLLCGTIYTATQPDYGSFDATSQQKPATQSQTSLPQTQSQEATGAETQGVNTEQAQPTQAAAGTQRPQPAPQPSQTQTEPQNNGNPRNNARQAVNQSKSNQNCNGTQVLFVCL